MNLIHYREVMLHANHWSTLFQKKFTIKGHESLTKDKKTGWLVDLNKIRNNADHEYSVSKEEHDYVAAIHDWLVLDDSEAIEKLQAEATEDEKTVDTPANKSYK